MLCFSFCFFFHFSKCRHNYCRSKRSSVKSNTWALLNEPNSHRRCDWPKRKWKFGFKIDEPKRSVCKRLKLRKFVWHKWAAQRAPPFIWIWATLATLHHPASLATECICSAEIMPTNWFDRPQPRRATILHSLI